MNVFYSNSHTYRIERLHDVAGEFALTLEDPDYGHEWPSDERVSAWAGCPVKDSGEGFLHTRIYEVLQ